jgi:predicted amidohydrolase YtcJ
MQYRNDETFFEKLSQSTPGFSAKQSGAPTGIDNKKLDITIYTARKVITMNRDQPEAEAVAVSDGKIWEVGNTGDIEGKISMWREKGWDISVNSDDQFSNDVIYPGFIEPHMHPQVHGYLWQFNYIGFFDRLGPDGEVVKGLPTRKDALAHIETLLDSDQAASGDQSETVVCWGYDPSLLEDKAPLTVEDFQKMENPQHKGIIVENASMHILYVNQEILNKAGITKDTLIPGVIKFQDGPNKGEPTGELQELGAMALVAPFLPMDKEILIKATNIAAEMSQRQGCTTIADAALGSIPQGWSAYREAIEYEEFPVRVVGFPLIDVINSNQFQEMGGLPLLKGYMSHQDHEGKLKLGPIKFITDGSVQGYTANLRWPYYYDGSGNGVQNIPLWELKKNLLAIHQEGFQAALHTNGDGASEIALKAVKYVLTEHPRPDHRHRLEHIQMPPMNQLEEMTRLGVAANFLVNHVYYWGNFHYAYSLGPQRVQGLDPVGSALKAGVRIGLHSDSSVTPVSPLFMVWVAVNRMSADTTAQGPKGRPPQLIGPEERISVEEGLKAITIDAAYLLFEDDIKGSVENGKLADFTILKKNILDPNEVPPENIKDVKVIATMMAGKVFPTS